MSLHKRLSATAIFGLTLASLAIVCLMVFFISRSTYICAIYSINKAYMILFYAKVRSWYDDVKSKISRLTRKKIRRIYGPAAWFLPAYNLSACPITPVHTSRATPSFYVFDQDIELGTRTRTLHFLQLPWDVRRLIYESYASSFRAINLLHGGSQYAWYTPLLRTCRQIRFESHPFLFAGTLFMTNFRTPFFRNVDLPILAHIRELEVYVRGNHADVQGIMGVLSNTFLMPRLRELHVRMVGAMSILASLRGLMHIFHRADRYLPSIRLLEIFLRAANNEPRLSPTIFDFLRQYAVESFPLAFTASVVRSRLYVHPSTITLTVHAPGYVSGRDLREG